jgi:hypothetical protein
MQLVKGFGKDVAVMDVGRLNRDRCLDGTDRLWRQVMSPVMGRPIARGGTRMSRAEDRLIMSFELRQPENLPGGLYSISHIRLYHRKTQLALLSRRPQNADQSCPISGSRSKFKPSSASVLIVPGR